MAAYQPFLGVDFLTDKHAGVDRETGSNGFILLAGVLMHNLRTQYQFTKRNISQIGGSEDAKDNWEEMTYLGSGAFSNVYKVGNGKFLKISRAASLEKSLGEELKILKVLEHCKENNGIPRHTRILLCVHVLIIGMHSPSQFIQNIIFITITRTPYV